MNEPRCFQCGFLLADINAACPKCLLGFYPRPHNRDDDLARCRDEIHTLRAELEPAENALREICLLVSQGSWDPSDGEGTQPKEVVEAVSKRLQELMKKPDARIFTWGSKTQQQPDWAEVNFALVEIPHSQIFEVDSGTQDFCCVVADSSWTSEKAQAYYDEHRFD